MKSLRNKTTVITGGASGLGREFALAAQRLGMNVVIADVQADALAARPELGEALRAQLREAR